MTTNDLSVIYALMFAILCMWIYRRKGRPMIYGFAVGFLLGAVGLIYALLRAPKE